MAALGTVGALVRVTPWDVLQYWASPESGWEFVDDRTPFFFRVAGWLEDGHIYYGLNGPVVDGPERYRGLICSIIVREDGSDWRVQSRSSAGFKVGPLVVNRNHMHDFRHPEGTILEGYPRISRFAEVMVVEQSTGDEIKRYIDGFVLPIPKHRVPEYQAIAEAACKIWKEHGALEYCECVGDDLTTDCSRTFSDMTNAKDDETVIFAWAVFKSRQARDAANEKIIADPRMAELMTSLANPENPIVDFQRMAHGGFREIVRG